MDCTCMRKPPRLPQREATIGRLKEQAEKAAARWEGDWVLPKSQELGYFRLISGSYRLPIEQQKVPGLKGFPGGAGGKESACQCRRCKRLGFDSWVRKIPCGKAWQSTPIFLPGEAPWMEEPGGLLFMGSQRVRHDWAMEVNWRIRELRKGGPTMSVVYFRHTANVWQGCDSDPRILPPESTPSTTAFNFTL